METPEIILKGAQSLFFKYGIKSVTMDDIAKHLGMSKKTIYQYFTDKDHILMTLIEDSMLRNKCECEVISAKSKNAVEEIMALMKYVGVFFSQINPNLFYDMQKYHPETWQLFRNFKEKFVLESVEDNLKKGIKDGLYRGDIDIKVIAKLRVEQIELAMNPSVFPPDRYRIGDVQMSLLDHYLHGIATIKGHKLINKLKEINEDE